MGNNSRFRRRVFTAVLLASLSLLAWAPAGDAGPDMGKDCVSCHKFKPGTPGIDRRVSPKVAAGVASPHQKRSKSDRAKARKGLDNTTPSAPGGRTTPRGNPSGKPGDPAPGTTIKR